jgi:hypothetical protein
MSLSPGSFPRTHVFSLWPKSNHVAQAVVLRRIHSHPLASEMQTRGIELLRPASGTGHLLHTLESSHRGSLRRRKHQV